MPCGARLLVGIGLWAGCAGPADPGPAPETRLSRIALGTLVEVVVRDEDPDHARASLEMAFAEIEHLESLLSEWRETSEISALNRAAPGAWQRLSPETARALDAARRLAAASGGAFDPTILPLLNLWGLAGGEPRIPDATELEAARKLVNWRRLEVDPEGSRARLLENGAAVSLGGIGKGFIADAVIDGLRQRGVPAALVAAAGDLACYGGSLERPWRVAVEDPDHPQQVFAELGLLEGGASTSAPTYRFFEVDGKRFHHILDPRTGRPARGTRSVTVLAPSATLADGYATALFVLGKRAPRLVREHPELRALILFEDGSRFVSPGLGVRWLPGVLDLRGKNGAQPGLVEGEAEQQQDHAVEGR